MIRGIRNIPGVTKYLLHKRSLTSSEASIISNKNKNIEPEDKLKIVRTHANSKILYSASRGLFESGFLIDENKLSPDDILELKRNLEKDGYIIDCCRNKQLFLIIKWSKYNNNLDPVLIINSFIGIFAVTFIGIMFLRI